MFEEGTKKTKITLDATSTERKNVLPLAPPQPFTPKKQWPTTTATLPTAAGTPASPTSRSGEAEG